MRRMLTTKWALVVIVGVLFALAWAIPSLGASAGKLARTALGRANESVYNSNLAVNTSNTAKNTANNASNVAAAANSAAATANNTANTALSLANGGPRVIANAAHSFDANNLASGGCTSTTFTQLGVASTDDVIVTAPTTLPEGVIAQAFTASNQVKLELCNVGGAVDPPNASYKFLVLR